MIRDFSSIVIPIIVPWVVSIILFALTRDHALLEDYKYYRTSQYASMYSNAQLKAHDICHPRPCGCQRIVRNYVPKVLLMWTRLIPTQQSHEHHIFE